MKTKGSPSHQSRTSHASPTSEKIDDVTSSKTGPFSGPVFTLDDPDSSPSSVPTSVTDVPDSSPSSVPASVMDGPETIVGCCRSAEETIQGNSFNSLPLSAKSMTD